MHNFDHALFRKKHHVDYIVESTEIVAAFPSCNGGATPFVIQLST